MNDSQDTKSYSRGTVTADKLRAVCSVINKVRIAKGWSILPAAEAEITASVWIEILDSGRIPPSAYEALYQRAMEARTRKMSIGIQAPDITPDLLVSLWIGDNGLKKELEDKVGDRLMLTESAESICAFCFGSGFRIVERDGVSGAIKCNHQTEE